MAPPSISNAQIWGAIEGLRTSVDLLREDARRADDQAREYRDKMYARLEANTERTTRLEANFGEMQRDVAEMKPTIAGLTALRAKAAGVIVGLGIVGTIVGGLIGLYASELKGWLFRLVGIH